MRPAGVRLWGPLAVAAVIVLTTAGWPWANDRIPGGREQPPGPLAVGGDTGRAWFTLGSGWTLRQEQSTPSVRWAFSRGDLSLVVSLVSLPTPDDADRLWRGLREVARVRDPSARLSAPEPVVNPHGAQGQQGVLERGGDLGEVAVFTAPDRSFAVSVSALGPPRTTGFDRSGASDVLDSVRFTGAAG